MDEGKIYDEISDAYDRWIGTVGDVDFYVDEAAKAEGPIVELGVGTGRVAIAIALRGIRVIGVDSSARMLAACADHARRAAVAHLLDLRLGDFRRPPVTESVTLVTCPFRTFSHLETATQRREALLAVRNCLTLHGRFVFDVSTPTPDDVKKRRTGWEEPSPGVWERAEWDWPNRRMDLYLRAAGRDSETHLRFAWLSRGEWRDALVDAGFEVVACYGWFDRRPCAASPLSIWVATPDPLAGDRPDVRPSSSVLRRGRNMSLL